MDYKNIYEKSFNNIGYNLHQDDEYRFKFVESYITKNNPKTIIDMGSGRGNILKILNDKFDDLEITSCDLKKFHNYDVPFYEINLCDTTTFEKLNDKKFDLLCCLDVMEHLEKKCLDDVLNFFSRISKNCLLTIANHSDILNGVELHLIQENMDYWSPVLEKYFIIENVKQEYNGRLYLINLKSK